MDKDRIQQVADRMARERYGYLDFYQLPRPRQLDLWQEAEKEVIEQDAAQADVERERRKYHGV